MSKGHSLPPSPLEYKVATRAEMKGTLCEASVLILKKHHGVSHRCWRCCWNKRSFGLLRGSNSITTGNTQKRNMKTLVQVV